MEKEKKEKVDLEGEAGAADAEKGTGGDVGGAPGGEPGERADGDDWAREKEELINLVQRKQADLDNFRRISRNKEKEIRDYGLLEFFKKLLPVLDNLERALATACGDESVPEAHYKGLVMIQKQILQLLEQEGVEPIEALGKPFDPHFHEAVMRSAESEGETDCVAEEIQKGYLYKERVLRPSRVVVK